MPGGGGSAGGIESPPQTFKLAWLPILCFAGRPTVTCFDKDPKWARMNSSSIARFASFPCTLKFQRVILTCVAMSGVSTSQSHGRR